MNDSFIHPSSQCPDDPGLVSVPVPVLCCSLTFQKHGWGSSPGQALLLSPSHPSITAARRQQVPLVPPDLSSFGLLQPRPRLYPPPGAWDWIGSHAFLLRCCELVLVHTSRHSHMYGVALTFTRLKAWRARSKPQLLPALSRAGVQISSFTRLLPRAETWTALCRPGPDI